jgi:hypothetical protein
MVLATVLSVAVLAAQPAADDSTLVIDFVEQKGDFKPMRIQIAHSGAMDRLKLGRACLSLRLAGDEKKLGATQKRVLELERRLPADQKWRAMMVLARLGAVEALPRLIQQAMGGEEGAVQQLAFFGSLPFKEGYYMPPGTVVFPAAPDARATKTLLTLWSAPDAGVTVSRASIVRALITHRGPEVDTVFAQAIADPTLQTEALGAALDTGREYTVEQLVPLLDSENEDAARLSGWVLGMSGRREAIEPLLAHLGAKRESVRWGARRGLSDLLGDASMEEARKHADTPGELAWWKARFGPRLERFDPARATRFKAQPPGSY